MNPTFFATPADLRAWFDANHANTDVLWIGFHRKGSSTPSITWPESVDEALCFGWIDGIRKRVDETSYMIRFTPRRRRSIWSAINVGRIAELERQGRVTEAGRKAFDARLEARTAVYSFEQRGTELDGAYLKTLKANRAAWASWQGRTPSYRKTHTWWVISAKKEETRQRRLAQLIASLTTETS
jgi:uncharacterized protein YdeI (YjbR/CyaY-like superfamily)